LLEIRVPDLAGYQNLGYARRYLDVVRRVADAESRTGTTDRPLAEAVARNLYKLMAYKDEYEVARLHLDPEFEREVEERFGAGAEVKFLLHPPVLRAMGMRRKIALGRVGRPVFRALRAARGLRGTAADPFGYAKVRRVERELVAEYVAVVDRLLARLSAGNVALAAEIAALPDMVRGYENIKLDNVAAYRARLAELLARYESADAAAAAEPPVTAPA
jgi:indolepyruvate ferredoxin oxidoreductase